MEFMGNEAVQVIEIHCQDWQPPPYLAQSISSLLMACQHKEPGISMQDNDLISIEYSITHMGRVKMI